MFYFVYWYSFCLLHQRARIQHKIIMHMQIECISKLLNPERFVVFLYPRISFLLSTFQIEFEWICFLVRKPSCLLVSTAKHGREHQRIMRQRKNFDSLTLSIRLCSANTSWVWTLEKTRNQQIFGIRSLSGDSISYNHTYSEVSASGFSESKETGAGFPDLQDID